jgi:sugar phosphate isomerase/epimerase
MRLGGADPDAQLTYCIASPAVETWQGLSRSLDEQVPIIKAAACPDGPMAISLELAAAAAHAALAPQALAAFKEQLARLGAYVFTVNCCTCSAVGGPSPEGGVHAPDWRSDARLAFTADSARLLAAILPDGMMGSISTVGGCLKASATAPDAVGMMVERLVASVADLVAVERRTGRLLCLALEPTPGYVLETTDEAIAFFEQLLRPAALARLAARIDVGRSEAEWLMRRHLGLCYDICHGTLQYESPLESLANLAAAGIAVPKIKLSAAIRVARMQPDLVDVVGRLDDGGGPRQTIVLQDGRLVRFESVREALAAFARGEAQGEWRVHGHAPLSHTETGPISSTRDDAVTLLRASAKRRLAPHLEVDTWDMLPSELRSASQGENIARDLAFVVEQVRT